MALDQMARSSSNPSLTLTPTEKAASFVVPSPNEPSSKKIEMYSPQFYAACTAGGILSCGLTHMAVTPLDLVKCNMQVRIHFDIIPRFSLDLLLDC